MMGVSSLKPNPCNPRLHSKKQIKQIANSIKSFGFNVPVLVDCTDQLIAGHGRVEAAKLLGMTEIPVIRIEHLTEAQAKAFAIADNRLTENSVWDDWLLAQQLKELSEINLSFTLDATGFTMDEIDLRIESLSGPIEKCDPADQVTDIGGPAVSQFGDLWQMGEHRLLCGDATNGADVGRVMNSKCSAMAFTDPPYNVDYGNSDKNKMRNVHRPILNDNIGDDFDTFLLSACTNILSVTDGAIYICMSSSALHTLQGAFSKAGGHWSTFIIWAKNTFTLGRADYQRQYEPILYGWREGNDRYWCGDRSQGDVWLIDKPAKNDLHPTMKPIELVMRALRNSSERGDLVLDSFMGSGSTLIAAERTGRICYGLELDPLYVDVAVRRWQGHTGEKAIHTGTGKCFDDIAKEMEVRHAGEL